jgi:hypothetical protein
VEVEQWGLHYADIVLRHLAGLIVSARFIEVFAANHLQGLHSIATISVVNIRFRAGETIETLPSYFKASVNYGSAVIDQQASDYIWRDKTQVCPKCLFGGGLKRFERLVIDESTWNGDDIFWPTGGTRTIVTERFRKVCVDNDVSGVVFRDLLRERENCRPWEDGENASGSSHLHDAD